jgi:methylamine dehydrogenase accessory protein MauD
MSCSDPYTEVANVQGYWAASYVVLWILVVSLAVIVVALARQIGTLHLRMGPRGALEMDSEGPPLGEAPESIATRDLAGSQVVVGGPGEARLLMFVSPGCSVCDQVMPALGPATAAAGMSPALLTDLDRDEAAYAFDAQWLPAPLIADPSVARAYDVPGTPFVVILDELGVVRAKGTPNNLEQMEGLIDTARRRMRRAVDERRAS